MRVVLGWLVVVTSVLTTFAQHTRDVTIEAEEALGRHGESFRDARSANGRCAVLLFAKGRELLEGAADLPHGDIEATFWLRAYPVEVLHGLSVRLQAGTESTVLQQVHFDPANEYQPFRIRFVHTGGNAAIRISGTSKSGFDGMRGELSANEQGELGDVGRAPIIDGIDLGGGDDGLELDLLEEDRNVDTLKFFDRRVLCDRVVFRCLRRTDTIVRDVTVDKIHYLPGETVQVSATVVGDPGDYELAADEITEIDSSHRVHTQTVRLADSAPQVVTFAYQLGDREFGHELRCALVRAGTEVHANSALFGVSRNVYRIGITARSGPQDMREFTAEKARNLMESQKAAYANYFERFAWPPCDYSNLAPERQIFYSGQTQYPGSVSGFRNLLDEAHRVGIKGITYGKACAAGIDGFNTLQRHPEFFHRRPAGLPSEQYSVFYLERMLANDYLLHAKPEDGAWQHWASLWTDWSNDATVEFGAAAIIASIRQFGWDGVRWDGHFVGNHGIFLDRLKQAYPNFVHGYNIAFANPKGKQFLPPSRSVDDFHEVARDHGLMMDESVRDWSHTNFSSGKMRPFYEAICREADYIKRIGGLPLFITFDMASPQDRTLNVLFGLAAGQRYTYITSPGDVAFGPLPKFLTRYSAFVWDDTRLVADPDRFVSVAVDAEPTPWWRHSTWLRQMPDGGCQLLVNLVNPPGYDAFCNRVQTPPQAIAGVRLSVAAAGNKGAVRAVHVSPDLPHGHKRLPLSLQGDRQQVTLPRLKLWSIVVFEYAADATPMFAVTTPVEDARDAMAVEPDGNAPAEPVKPAKIPHYRDYANTRNTDLGVEEELDKPVGMAIVRNGVLDVHHARGPFSWLNPFESAAGLLGGSDYEPSWVDYVGFKLRDNGCMDGFPDSYDKLLGFDVLILDNVHARELGGRRRAMIAGFVRAGGGLVIMGGLNNLSHGADHNTYLAELLPVRISQHADALRNDSGLALHVEKEDLFAGTVDWSVSAHAFMVDTSPLKEDVYVIVSAGGKPAIVAHRYGQGRVVTVLMNPHGDCGRDTNPYWQWTQWPKVLAGCLKWLGEGAWETVERVGEKRGLDRTKPTPEEVMMDAFDMDSATFTRKLRQARDNIVDADTARMLLEAAVDNHGKVEDPELLPDVVRRASPYFDPTFAALGEKLARADLPFVRQAGYRILGLAGDPRHLPLLEGALRKEKDDLAREALVAIGRVGVPESADAIRAYVQRGSERLLALSALLRFGDRSVLNDALDAYLEARMRRIRLKSGRKAVYEDLYGGVSFKLTPAQRKSLRNTYDRICDTEEEAAFDLRYFMESLGDMSDDDLVVFAEFLRRTENREILSLAYTVLGGLDKSTAARCRAKLADAKLAELRLLADG